MAAMNIGGFTPRSSDAPESSRASLKLRLPAKAWTDAALAPAEAENPLKSHDLVGTGVRIIILGAGAAGNSHFNKNDGAKPSKP